MIDTHCHLTYPGLIERLDQVLANAAAAGVDRMLTIGTSPDDARQAVRLAQEHPRLYAAVGLHPHHTPQWQDKSLLQDALRELLAHPRVVALGEMGLDRHYPDPPLEMQRRVLEWQLELMQESPQLSGVPGVPGIIHNREATADTLAVLRASGIAPHRLVFHCFTGSDAELDAILEFGAWVGFTGIVTFKSAKSLLASATRIPLDRLLVETDSPYLTPEPHRKVKTNEPCYVAVVARFLAAARGMAERDFRAAVDANAERFFRLPLPSGEEGPTHRAR